MDSLISSYFVLICEYKLLVSMSFFIFQHIPYLRQFAHSIDSVLEQWREYKQNVPTFGAILLNKELTHVLLVQSYWARTSWGFPKGKVNKEEDPTKCAVREVRM